MAGGCSPSPRPLPAPPQPGPATGPATNSAASSTGLRDRSGPFPSRPSWSPCSATTTAATAPHPTAGCFAERARGPLSESSYGRTWHTARTQAFGPAAAATALARRPYDLRHAALSLWLNAGAAPAQIAQRAGHSITMLLAVYTHCIDGQDNITNRQIEHALHTGNQARSVTASGSANRRYRPILSAICPWMAHTRAHGRPPAHHAQPQAELPTTTTRERFRSSKHIQELAAGVTSGLLDQPDLAHTWPTTPASGLRNRLLSALEPLTQVRVNGSDLGFCVAGVGFEPT